LRRVVTVGLGVMIVVVSTAALIYNAVTPAPILGHPDPHGDGLAAVERGLQAAISAPGTGGSVASRTASAHAPAAVATAAPPAAPPRTGVWIEIPILNIALPLAKGNGSANAANIPLWKAFVYPGTVWRARPGNSYIYAHAQWGMFANLLYARVGDAGYIHDYGSGRVLTFHVSRIVGQVRYNDGTWLHYQAHRPTLTLQTCMDWNPTGNRYIVQLT
jgi:LPXTG-site transpeptidase (sortase) family protein